MLTLQPQIFPQKHAPPASPEDARIQRMLTEVRAGQAVADFRFDQIFPEELRRLSRIHWTPVEVAQLASRFLAPTSESRVLDVGSGIGKCCLVGALTTAGTFTGVEQRPHLANIARDTAEKWRIERASFISGNMINVDWNAFDGFYLYNPFYENLHDTIRIDQTLPFGPSNYERYIRIVTNKLLLARAGTRVVTYHGFGGKFPAGYERVRQIPYRTNFIEFWAKQTIA